MKKLLSSLSVLALSSSAFGDTLTLFNGSAVTGTVLQTNVEDILLLTDYGATLHFSLTSFKSIGIEPGKTEPASTNRLPDSKSVIRSLSKQPWASNLDQIPATVIDKGMLMNVPYISFRCGEDYEVNIYGDLDRPAGIEAGVYRKLLDDPNAKANCLKFVTGLLGLAADKEIIPGLKLEKDRTIRDGMTFEITPPTDGDAYLGWWISVYDEARLDKSRATPSELTAISVSKSAAKDDWSKQELELSRPSNPKYISFVSPSGTTISNAEVVRVIDGSGLVWRDGVSGGVIKLADLPEDLRRIYGYDAAKAAVADAAEKDKRARDWQQTQAQIATAQSQPPAGTASDYTPFTSSSRVSSYSPPSSDAGRVYVRSYTRKDGTLVRSHTRSSPSRR